MANNYYQATISPNLPAASFRDEELELLAIACGLSAERDGDDLYFFADDYFCAEGDDEADRTVNCLALMQEKLRQLDLTAYPAICIEGAATCSKMRPGEFGGFAYFITRDDIRSVFTGQWLHEQAAAGGDE